MAHLFVRDASAQWAVLPLDGRAYDLGADPPRAADSSLEDEESASAVVLLGAGRAEPAARVLLAGPHAEVWVNGMPLLAGIHVLADRDEIRVGGTGTVFFSTESLPVIEKFPGGDRRIVCPRCKLEIEAGTDAVRCPGCSVWHHQLADRACFTYDEKCAACGNKSDLNAGYQWIPEEV